jgi:hypothetical protein
MWEDSMVPFIQAWNDTEQHIFSDERPHDDETFTVYLQWYFMRTQACVLHVLDMPLHLPPVPSTTYPFNGISL